MQRQEKILIVDDHGTNIEILEDLLSECYPLASATSGKAALQMAPVFQPALILLDVMMPGIDGYETCRQLRANPILRYTKILMVSAKATDADRLAGYEAGADDYITKPFNKDELRAKVRVYLRLKSVEEVNQLKSDMLTLLSHETRTPLNGILGPIEMLREDSDIDEEEHTLLLDMIHHSARDLLRFFERIVTLSTMKAGEWPFELILADLCEVVRGALRELTPQALERRITITQDLFESARTKLDPEHMKTVVTSILDNAIRFSPLEGCVALRVARDADHWCLTVTDQGDGIDPGFMPQLFEEFARSDLKHHAEGHGLSLALARQIVRAYEGSISADSALGEGTTFTVRLPLANAECRMRNAE